jgi:hypothetical protein
MTDTIEPAAIRAPAACTYRGTVTTPERWSTWQPRGGDVLVCTPAKCGTTWTQSIIAMLLNGGPDLPQPVPVLSPWVDADLGVPAERVAAALAAQPGRRVVKTHTPADGYPIWEGVHVVAVYRHPLDVFLSLRKHLANRNSDLSDNPMTHTLPEAFDHWLEGGAAPDDIDRDTLASLVLHFRHTALSGRLPDPGLFHYADMFADLPASIAGIARAIGIDPDPQLVARVAEATAFAAMKARPEAFAPVAGTGFWKSDASFFASGGTGKWQGQLSAQQHARFEARLAELVPEADARCWLEQGGAWSA